MTNVPEYSEKKSGDLDAAHGHILSEKDYQAFLNVYVQQKDKRAYLKYLYNLFKDYNENFLGYFYKVANDRLNKEYQRLHDLLSTDADSGNTELIILTELKQIVNDVLRDATMIQEELDQTEN
jgi:hypothetical protein